MLLFVAEGASKTGSQQCCTAPRKCVHWSLSTKVQVQQSTCGLVAMTSASHAEGRQFDPGSEREARMLLTCNRGRERTFMGIEQGPIRRKGTIRGGMGRLGGREQKVLPVRIELTTLGL